MNKQDIIDFFNSKAPTWDERIIVNEEIINTILDNARIFSGEEILDVACGTGVMIPYYLKRNIRKITAIDLSPEMIRICKDKHGTNPNLNIICGDVLEYKFPDKFDAIMVYNAFPHFSDSENLIKILAGLLKESGRLSICHGLSREAINSHHSAHASKISIGLMSAEELKNLFTPYFKVDTLISNDKMFQVCGSKK